MRGGSRNSEMLSEGKGDECMEYYITFEQFMQAGMFLITYTALIFEIFVYFSKRK